MEKSITKTLIIVSGIVFLGILAFVASNSFGNSDSNSVQVQGSSVVNAVPDVVSVYFSIETNGSTSKEAKDTGELIYNSLKSEIVKIGFEEKDLKTQSLNIYPEYDWSKGTQKIIGYKSVHSVKLEFSADDIQKISPVLDAGINSGAGISYINFELSQEMQNQYKAKAMKTAAEDAKIKAEAVASGFDKKVGRLVSVQVSEFGYYPWRAYDSVSTGNAESAKASFENITPEEKEISASVMATYKLR